MTNPTPDLCLIGWFNSADSVRYSWPLIRMTADSSHVTFAARFGLGRFAGPWVVRREDVTTVRRSTWLGGGVEILTGISNTYVFGTMQRDVATLLTDLARLGYPTDIPDSKTP